MKILVLSLCALTAFSSTYDKSDVEKKYPGYAEAASCSGEFLGRKAESVLVIQTKEKKAYLVLWVGEKGEISELETIPRKNEAKFELQCMNPKKAETFRKNAEGSEGIHTFLKFPKGNGILCYHKDDVTAKCWTFDKKTKKLVEAGGWQT